MKKYKCCTISNVGRVISKLQHNTSTQCRQMHGSEMCPNLGLEGHTLDKSLVHMWIESELALVVYCSHRN